MTKRTYISPLLACLLGLMAGAPASADEVADDNVQRCISTRTLTGTRIVDDVNILFFKSGKTVYHNILPKQCKGLARHGHFSYGAMAGSICERDAIRVINGSSGMFGGSCLLGFFHKITDDDVAAIYERRYRPVTPQPVAPAEVEDVTEESDESTEPDAG